MSLHDFPAAGGGVRGLDIEPQDTFIAVYEDVWQALKGHGSLHVYMALKRRVHPGNTSWFSTRKVLADESGVSVNTFDRGVRHLVNIGLVVVQHRYVPAGWKGDGTAVVFERDDEHPQQIGSLYHVRYHLPTPPQKRGYPLPKYGETPSPKWGNRYITPDIDPREGGKASAESLRAQHTPPPPSPSPSSDDPPPAAAGAVPSDWCTAEHPRCRDHAHIEDDVDVPACGGCGRVREWWAARAATAVQEQRTAVQDCEWCDDRGMVSTEDTAGRPVAVLCVHQGPPERPDAPEVHTPAADPSIRQQALRELRRRRAG